MKWKFFNYYYYFLIYFISRDIWLCNFKIRESSSSKVAQFENIQSSTYEKTRYRRTIRNCSVAKWTPIFFNSRQYKLAICLFYISYVYDYSQNKTQATSKTNSNLAIAAKMGLAFFSPISTFIYFYIEPIPWRKIDIRIKEIFHVNINLSLLSHFHSSFSHSTELPME